MAGEYGSVGCGVPMLPRANVLSPRPASTLLLPPSLLLLWRYCCLSALAGVQLLGVSRRA